jgi:hypothetical protein
METLGKEIFAPDIVWHQPGRNPTSGDYQGADGVLGLFGKLFELTDGTFKATLHDVLATDDHVVALGKIDAQRKGMTAPHDFVHVCHVKEGKLSECWIVNVDPYGVDDFFNA